MSTFAINGSVAFQTMASSSIDRTSTAGMYDTATAAAGQAGTLSTRTNDTSGTATLASGHTITTGATVSIFWTGGSRYNVTVGTVSGTSVPFSGGSGDNLPDQDTAIVVGLETNITFTLDGDTIEAFGAISAARTRVTFFDNASPTPAVIVSVDQAAGEHLLWWSNMGFHANPFAGETIGSISISTGSTSAASFKVGAETI